MILTYPLPRYEGREDRTKSVKYLRKGFGSRSRILVVNSMAISAGQFCDGRKTVKKYSYASLPRVRPSVCKKLASS